MRRFACLFTALIACGASAQQNAAPVSPVSVNPTPGTVVAPPTVPPVLSVYVGGLRDGAIPPKLVYCQADASSHTKDGGNRSPDIRWTKGPAGTKSYAIIAVDPDVPTVFTDANQAGRTIPAALPRQSFYHWVLLDIPSNITSLPEGVDSSGVSKQGKPVGSFAYGVRGVNDYGKFHINGDTHGGYDGPCPPWNDEIVHHYHFKVFALDVPALHLEAPDGPTAIAAMAGHVLAEGEAVGTYTQNLQLPKPPLPVPTGGEVTSPDKGPSIPVAAPAATSPLPAAPMAGPLPVTPTLPDPANLKE